MVGCAVAALLRRHPLDRLELVDVDGSRRGTADRLGVPFCLPKDAAGDCDLVFHCSATSEGLNTGLQLLGEEADLVELSWYGNTRVQVDLGSGFHARRLRLRASQVGAVSQARRARRTPAQRLALALNLLRDPAFDALIETHLPFTELPDAFRRLATGELRGSCHVVDYGSAR